jgi:uncharacterized membrane protein
MTESVPVSTVSRVRRRVASWYNPIAITRGLFSRPKLYLAIVAAIATLYLAPLAAPQALSFSARLVAAWIAGATVYLVLAAFLMSSCSSHAIRERAAAEDETRFVFMVLILLAIATSFAAVISLIGEAKQAQNPTKAIDIALAGVAIVASWLVMQVLFTLHYAHDYYRVVDDTGGIARGLDFPKDDCPDYWDFFYFTTSIGASSQTSDVSITSKPARRLVTVQAVMSFVYNTTVVALAINLASGLM